MIVSFKHIFPCHKLTTNIYQTVADLGGGGECLGAEATTILRIFIKNY